MAMLALTAALAAVMPGLEANMDYDDVTRVEYRYTDSSVPPRYHRSFVIEVTRDTARVVVDSYGDVLARDSRAIAPEEFRAVLETIEGAGLTTVTEKENEGCTGGTTETVVMYGDEDELFRGWVYHCAGEDYGTLEGDVEAVARDIRALIPDLSSLRE